MYSQQYIITKLEKHQRAIDYLLSQGGGGGSVSTVFGRAGNVTAQSGDYTFNQIDDKPTTVSGYGITDAVPTSRTINGNPLSSDVVLTKGDISLGNVENVALSTWNGTTNITTVGTLTSGEWNGSTISVGNGGTGNTSFTAGYLLFGNGTGSINTNSNFYWDNVNSRLGIGVGSTVSAKLHLLASTEQLRIGYDVSIYTTFIVGSNGYLTITPSGSTMEVTKIGLFSATTDPIKTTTTASSSNLWVMSSAGSQQTTLAQLLFTGATITNGRVVIRGSGGSAPAANSSYGSFQIGQEAVSIASSGTHKVFAQQIIHPLSVSTGSGTLTNSASLYIPSIASNATNNYSIWVETGAARFDGNLLSNSFRQTANSTAPTSATDTGVLGEIRITQGYLFYCYATNNWVRAALTTF